MRTPVPSQNSNQLIAHSLTLSTLTLLMWDAKCETWNTCTTVHVYILYIIKLIPSSKTVQNQKFAIDRSIDRSFIWSVDFYFYLLCNFSVTESRHRIHCLSVNVTCEMDRQSFCIGHVAWEFRNTEILIIKFCYSIKINSKIDQMIYTWIITIIS